MIRYCLDGSSWQRSSDDYHLLLVMLASCQPIRHVLSRHVAKFLKPPHELSRLQAIAQARELRIAGDGLAYSRQEFIEHYALEKGRLMWNTATPQACTEFRTARDGLGYSYGEFMELYGEEKGQLIWNTAPTLPGHKKLHVFEPLSGRSWEVNLPGEVMHFASSTRVYDPMTSNFADAQHIVVALETQVFDSKRGMDGLYSMVVVDASSGMVELQSVPNNCDVTALAMSADGYSIAIGLEHAYLRILHVPFKQCEVVGVEDVVALAYTPSGDELVAWSNELGSEEGKILSLIHI